ncbi:MAG: hypothetical protein QXW79_01355 [Thermoplasmata archaeon]
MSEKIGKIDPKMLYKNFQDLDYISQKLENEYYLKNKVLERGLKSCLYCSKLISEGISNTGVENKN